MYTHLLITKMTCKINSRNCCHPAHLSLHSQDYCDQPTSGGITCDVDQSLSVHHTMSLLDKPGEPSGGSIPLYVVDGVATVWDAQSELLGTD